MAEAEKTEKSHCNECGHETKHVLIASRTQRGQDEGADLQWRTTWNMLECCGCEGISLRKTFWFSEADGDEITYFPPLVSRNPPTWVNRLKPEMRAVLNEVYTALNADSRRLAVIGARTVIDMLMTEKVRDIGSFPQKLDALVMKGFLSQQNRDYLNAALEAGNAAAHRGHAPMPLEVSHVMDIVENLLQAVYVLPAAGKMLKQNTPKRPRRRKQSKPTKP